MISNVQPTKVDFFDDILQVEAGSAQTTLDTAVNANIFRNYGKFEQYIPRRTASPNDRMQGNVLVYKITHNLEEEFKLSTVEIQSKLLK